MIARILACVALGLAGCVDDGARPLKGFKPPLVTAKEGYCPELIESCPVGSHPVTGARAAAECSDVARLIEHGWKTEPRDTSKPLPLVVGRCKAQDDCLVYCRFDAPCEAQQVSSDAVVCTRPVCGQDGCEIQLGEHRACGPNSVANCSACPVDCPDGCADGVDEPGESCEPCTPYQNVCVGELVRRCRETGIGFETNEDCSLTSRTCMDGSCVPP